MVLPPGADRIEHAAVTAAAPRLQRQPRQHVHPVLLAQHRVRHLEQHPAGTARAADVLAIRTEPGPTESHGHPHATDS